MQATQSSSASGKWRRTEQFAALRYISRHLEMDAMGSRAGQDDGLVGRVDLGYEGGLLGGGARGWQPESWLPESWEPGAGSGSASGQLAREAGELLRALRVCSERLAGEWVSFADRERCVAELGVLRDRSWALMERFLREQRMARAEEFGGEAPGYGVERKTLERGAAGWIAC